MEVSRELTCDDSTVLIRSLVSALNDSLVVGRAVVSSTRFVISRVYID